MKNRKLIILPLLAFISLIFLLNSCSNFNKTDARKFPPDPTLRVKKNIEEGRGFRLMDTINNKSRSGEFDFASSNELWRASLDTIDFMPLVSANYSGGIIISDWYSDGNSSNESIKISIRFLSNEIRSDAINVKVFYKKCSVNVNCKISEKSGNLVAEIKKQILKKAAVYEKQKKEKNFRPYTPTIIEDD